MRAGTSTEFNPIFPMSNQPTQIEQQLSSIIGQSYSGGWARKIELLHGALASRTIPDQLALLEGALLSDHTSRKLEAELAAIRAENDGLKQKLAEANTRADNAIGSAKSAMRAEVEKLADQRARELLAMVGQPMPTRVTANSGVDADKPRTGGVDAVAESYRQKYGIS